MKVSLISYNTGICKNHLERALDIMQDFQAGFDRGEVLFFCVAFDVAVVIAEIF